jgi:hypothetical protein
LEVRDVTVFSDDCEALLQHAFRLAGGTVGREAMWRALAALTETAWIRLLHCEVPPGARGDGVVRAQVCGVPVDEDTVLDLLLAEQLSDRYGDGRVNVPFIAIAINGRRSPDCRVEAMQDAASAYLGSALMGLDAASLADMDTDKSMAAPEVPGPRSPSGSAGSSKPPGDKGLALATWIWRGAWLAAVALGVLAVTSAPCWYRPIQDPAWPPRPPYDQPAVAKAILSSTDLSALLRVRVVGTEDGPPVTKLYTSSGSFASYAVRRTQVGAWHREWNTPDSRTVIDIQATDYRSHDLATGQSDCDPTKPIVVAGARRAGFEPSPPGAEVTCAEAVVGRTFASVRVLASSGAELPDAQRIVTLLAARQFAGLKVAPDLPDIVSRNSPTRDIINRLLYIGVLAVAVGLALPTLADRATRRRLTARLRRRKYGLQMADVSPIAVRDEWVSKTLGMARMSGYLAALRLAEATYLGFRGTLALTLAVFVAATVIERRVRRRPIRIAGATFRGPTLILAMVGLAATAVIAACGATLALMAVSIRAFGVNPLGQDYVLNQIAVLMGVGAVVVFTIALLPFTLVRRLAMRQLTKAAASDGRPSMLLLRSFTDDGRRLRSRRLDRASIVERLCIRRRERFEEVVAFNLARYGAVEGLGEPGQLLPPARGAVRRNFDHSVWQGGVRSLITDARFVCVILGRTESLMWEIRQIRAAGALDKTIFVLPPTGTLEQRRRLKALSHTLGVPWARFGRRDADGRIVAVVFPDGLEAPFLLTVDAPDDLGYDAALEAAVALLKPDVMVRPEVRALLQGQQRHARGTPPLDRDPTAVPEPPLKIFPPGKAPKLRKWYRGPFASFRLNTAARAVTGVLTAFVLLQDPKIYRQIDIANHTATSISQDADTGTVYAVLDYHYLVSVNLNDKTTRLITSSNDAISRLLIRDSVAYGSDDLHGSIVAFDLRTGRSLWRHSGLGSLAGLTITTSGLAALSPPTGAVYRLDPNTGRTIATRILSGLPWDLTSKDDHTLAVALNDRAQVVVLDASTLNTQAQHPTITDPSLLVPYRNDILVYSSLQHQVAPLAPAPGSLLRITLENQHALLDSNGGWLAITGLQRVTLFSARPTGIFVKRLALPLTSPTALCVTRDGQVIVGNNGSIDRLG